ncbi:hypothetical protein PYCC9005_001769 [Savitreella phatthalungensis]
MAGLAKDFPDPSQVTLEIPDKDILSFVFDSPTVTEDTVIYVDADDESRTIKYGEAQVLLRKIAAMLRRRSVRDGDVVLCFSPNSILFPVVIYGTICAGAVFTGANPTLTANELAHQVRDSRAKIILADAALEQTARNAVQIVGGAAPAEVLTFQQIPGLLTKEEYPWKRISDPTVLREQTAIILYSSGTTGLPKGVELTHRNVVANSLQSTWVKDQGDALREKHGEDPIEGPFLGHLPMYHAYGLSQACNGAFRHGTTWIVTRKFDFPQMLGLIQKHKIMALGTVPPVVTLLAKHPLVDKFDLSSLRMIGSGAAPLGDEVIAALRKRLHPKLKIGQGYGLSECTTTATTISGIDDDRDGSIGRPVPMTEIKLIDPDTGEEITGRGPEHRGELLLRGPQIMKGYLRNPKATAETIDSDGWLHTGDIAVRSVETGNAERFWIVDRRKELIKVKGNQVAPAELEALLLSHDSIADACVIGVPHKDAGEVPRAYVVKSATGSALTAEELLGWMSERVARFKVPKGGVVFVDTVPKSPSGKLLRRELRERAKREMSAKL